MKNLMLSISQVLFLVAIAFIVVPFIYAFSGFADEAFMSAGWILPMIAIPFALVFSVPTLILRSQTRLNNALLNDKSTTISWGKKNEFDLVNQEFQKMKRYLIASVIGSFLLIPFIFVAIPLSFYVHRLNKRRKKLLASIE
jgi:hypothetical protein